MVRASAKAEPFLVLALALKQRGRMEFAAERHVDDRPAKHRDPAPVLARTATLLEMRFIEVEIMSFELAIPAILEIRALAFRYQAVILGGFVLLARTDIVRIGNAEVARDRGVDADLDRLLGFLDRQISPPANGSHRTECQEDLEIAQPGRGEPEEAEHWQQRNAANEPAVEGLFLRRFAHCGLIVEPASQLARHQSLDIRLHRLNGPFPLTIAC